MSVLRGRGRLVRRRGAAVRRRHKVGLNVGLVILGLVILLSIFVPVFDHYGPDDLSAAPFLAPSLAHPFGTDDFGRDVFVRVWAGGRLDLAIAVIVVGCSLLFGTFIGVASGASRRRWVDGVAMRFVDAIVAFPFIILILALLVIIGQSRAVWILPPGAPAVIIAVSIVGWTVYARLARAQTLALTERDFVTAARMLGYPQSRIVRRHLLPIVFRTTSSYAVVDLIIVIITTASLAFLGAGVQAPTPEWGSIMFEGRAFLATSWWITVMPGVILALTGLAVSLIADALLTEER